MAVQYKKKYTSEAEFMYDVAQASPYFRQDTYQALRDDDLHEDYVYAAAGAQNRDSINFVMEDYDLLSGQDRLQYLLTEFYTDKNATAVDEDTGETYNIYERNREYLDTKINEIIDKQTYESLNTFEKITHTIKGFIGNAVNELFLGTYEGLMDTILLLGGQKDLIKEDMSGYTANKEKLQRYMRAYTYIDKSKILSLTNDVFTGLTKMAPMLIPGAGTPIYFAGMAGNTAEQAVLSNPDINYWALLGYTAGVTGLEFATEKLSSIFFGGSAIDNLVFNTTSSKTGSWIGRVGLDFLSEGFEESISEFADSVLYTILVDNNAPVASLSDVLYAGLVGGLIGGVGASTQIAATQKQTILKDGTIISTKSAKTLGLDGTELSKTQSLNLLEQIENAKNILNDDAITKLQAKYSNEKLSEIKKNHKEEYDAAVSENEDNKMLLAESTLGLAKILEMAGVEGFGRAVDLASYVTEQYATLIENYVRRTTNPIIQNRNVEKLFAIKNPGSSIQIADVLSTTQQTIKNQIKSQYGIDVYFGTIGEKNGVTKKYGLTLDDHTIVIDIKNTRNMSLNKLLNDIVKEELVHTLQYNKQILNAESVNDLLQQYKILGGRPTTKTKLDKAYENESDLTKISESQAKALAQVLLFDEISIERIFMTNRNVFVRTYAWLKNIKTNLENIKTRRTEKDRIKYNTILKTMRTYREAAANVIGNEQDALVVKKELALTDEQLQELIDTYIPDYTSEHFTLLKDNYTIHAERRHRAEKTLGNNRPLIMRLLPLSYRNIYNTEYYMPEFVKNIMDRNPKRDFRYNLQEYMITEFGFTINQTDGCLMEVIDFNKVTTKDFELSLSDLIADKTSMNKYTTLDKIFNDTFVMKFNNENGTNSLMNIQLRFVVRDSDVPTQAEYRVDIDKNKSITCFISKNRTLKPAEINEIKHNLFHEITHALSDIQGLSNGTSPSYVLAGLREAIAADNTLLYKLGRMLLTDEFYTQNINNQEVLLANISFAIYRLTDGEYAAESYKSSQTRNKDSIVNLKAGATMNRSGFRTDGITLHGYGRFKGIILSVTSKEESQSQARLNALREATVVVSYNKRTQEVDKFLKANNVTDLKAAGFSKEFINAFNDNEITTYLIKDMINTNSLGSPEATNLMIKYYWPNNQHTTSLKDINAAMSYGIAQARIYTVTMNKTDTSFDKNRAVSIEEMNQFFEQNPKYIEGHTNQKTGAYVPSMVENEINNIFELLTKEKNTTARVWLLNHDYDYSYSKTRSLYLSMKGQGLNSDADTKTFSEFDINAKDNPEELDVMDALSEDTLSPDKVLEIKETAIQRKTELEKELNEAENKLKKTVPTSKTEETIKREIFTLKRQLEQVNTMIADKPVLFEEENEMKISDDSKKDTVLDVAFVENSDDFINSIVEKINEVKDAPNLPNTKNVFSLVKRVENIKYDIIKKYGEDVYKKLHKLIPQTFKEYKNKINNAIKALNTKTNLTTKEQALLSVDYSKFSYNEMEEYLGRLQDLKNQKDEKKSNSKTKTDTKKETEVKEESKKEVEIKEETIKNEAPIKTDEKLEAFNAEIARLRDSGYVRRTINHDIKNAERRQYEEEGFSELSSNEKEQIEKRTINRINDKIKLLEDRKTEYLKQQTLEKQQKINTNIDSENNQLTPQQEKYFKNSKIRNEKGELLVLYHGSNVNNIDIFNIDNNIPNNFFTTSEKYAKEYSGDRTTGEPNGKVYKVYLNITNPFDALAPENSELTKKILGYIPTTRTIQDTDKIYAYLKTHETGFDGIIAGEELSNKMLAEFGENANISYVPLNANQIKLVDNKTPTKNVSISDTELVKPENNTLIKKSKNKPEKIKEIKSEVETPKQIIATVVDNKVSTLDTKDATENIANKFISDFKLIAKTQDLSEAQLLDMADKEYTKLSYDMIIQNPGLFCLINDSTYDEIRQDIVNSKDPLAKQALTIFDLYCVEMKGKFNKTTQEKIENNTRQELTDAAQKLAMQSRRVAEHKPVSDILNKFKEQGYVGKISDELLIKYDKKLADKDAYIEELSAKITELENQLKSAQTDLERLAISNEIKDVADKKLIIENGTNEDIADYLVTNEESLETASQIQQDIVNRALAAAEKAEAEGKNIGFYYYEDGTPKPFPKTREKIAKIVKGAKSFRFWAMLCSPVTWVRNWVGNTGMKLLDAATNSFERIFSKKTNFNADQLKYNETKGGKELYKHIAKENETFISEIIVGKTSKYDDTAEAAADVVRTTRKLEYESASTFKKLCLKAQDINDWGLSTGPLGDTPMVFNSICKNMGNLVASNSEYLLQGIKNEFSGLSDKRRLTPKQQARKKVLEKALQTKNSIDIFNAISKEETARLFDVAKELSFKQYFKNSNGFSKWASDLSRRSPIAGELMSWILPFPRVASNILAMAWRYSPAGFISGLMEWSQAQQVLNKDYTGPSSGTEQATYIRTFSQATVGTIMLVAGVLASVLGWVDIDEDDYLGPCLNIGDIRIGLSNLAPSMTVFSTAAAMTWAYKNNKNAVTEGLNVLYDNTLLGNIDNLFRYSSLEKFGENLSINYLGQYIPAVVKLINKSILQTPTKDKSGPYLDRLTKTLKSYIPGLSNTVPNKINPYTGEKMYASNSSNWFLNFIAGIMPLDIKYKNESALEIEAERLNATTTGFSGSFTINDKKYTLDDKSELSKYRANYINTEYNKLISGSKLVTVENQDGKEITTKYEKLTDKQKKKVLENLYTQATAETKIKYWTDLGNIYIVTDKNKYSYYKQKFGANIQYASNWSKSKFVER